MNTARLQCLVQRACQAFELRFGQPPALCVQAPGRVNLIGEHTDYNDGFVLPCAIDRHTVIAARARHDGLVRVLAADLALAHPAFDQFDVGPTLTALPSGHWANHVRGVVAALWPALPTQAGADLAIAGDVPQGAGLSSSASLEVAVAQAFKCLFGLHALSPLDLARAAQQAEHQFVGTPCGIMDMLASAAGKAGHALLIDCRQDTVHALALPPDVAVLVVHSGVQRTLASSAYSDRRQQCAAAAQHFGVAALRDVPDLQTLPWRQAAETLDATTLRRARHVVTENRRTTAFAQALQNGDLLQMGLLLAQSQQSMRDDFEITVPAVDALVALLQHHIGTEGGARMTGGGFGGCVVALLRESQLPAVMRAVATGYRTPSGQSADLWRCQAAAGAGVLPGAAVMH